MDNPYNRQQVFEYAKLRREEAEATREGFTRLHSRQKSTFGAQADRLDNFQVGAGGNLNSISRLRVYVSLTDINLGIFINDAKVRAKHAYLSGARDWHQQYTIDVADVDIKMRGRAVRIRIQPADRFVFEFASSAHPVVTEVTSQDGLIFPTYKAVIVGVDVRIKDNRMRVTPEIRKEKRSTQGQELSIINRGFQVQLMTEPVQYPFSVKKLGRVRTTHITFESFAPGNPWVGPALRTTDGPISTFSTITSGGPSASWFGRDVHYDVPWGDNSQFAAQRLAYIRGDADWPRASGKQRVEDKDFGTREFALYIDDFNQLMVFPTAGIGPLSGADATDQNVPEFLVKRLPLPVPAWGYVPTMKAKDYWDATPDLKKWCVDQPETDWKFHPDGTKCAAIIFEREAFTFDTTFWSTGDVNPNQAFTISKFDALQSWYGILPSFVGAFSPDTYNNQRYYTAPGVVEIEIKIELTGPGLEHYSVDLKAREVRRPSTSEGATSRWALFVDYVWFDLPKRTNTNAAIKKGALVAFDLEYWVNPKGSVAEDTARQGLFCILDLNTGGDLCNTTACPLLAIDLKTLSFVLRLDGYSHEMKHCFTAGGSSADVRHTIHHFGALIVHSGVPKEVLYPATVPEEMKVIIDSYAVLNGREFLASRITGGDGWQYVPVTTDRDGWSNTDLAAYRDGWAHDKWFWYDQWYAAIDPDVFFYGTGYPDEGYLLLKTPYSASGYGPNGTAAEKWLNTIGGGYRNLFFSTNPRWGWNQYCGLIALFVCLDHSTTFFAHPNGSYAFWSDAWVYDRNGLPSAYVVMEGPGGTVDTTGSSVGGLDYRYNTLSAYTADKVEHVIFDRVHFEIQAKDQKAKTRNTTFLELYNKAVALADPEQMTDQNILPVNYKEHVQATFTKEIGNDGTYECLDLKLTWGGVDWWYPEFGISNLPTESTPQFPPQTGQVGNFNNLNLYGLWRRTAYAGGGSFTSPGFPNPAAPSTWHFKFADPIIISEK